MASNDKDAPTDLARSRAELSRPQVLAMWDGGSSSCAVAEGKSITIGRASDCDVVIDHPSVSRRHALLSLGPPARIEDLGSANGTRIGELLLRSGESAPLDRGHAVGIGEALLVIHGAAEALGGARELAPGAPGHPSGLENTTIVNDAVTRRVHEMARLVAKSSIPVLLLGETGVGKDVLAEAIHRNSPRANRPLVRVNCAAMPSPLLESELFGYERGAFTGAGQAKIGLVESADGGTVFLDEMCELELSMQAKLLHVLERGEVMRVGSLRPRPVDVRFVAATNRNIEELVAQGSFRKDLYFRLKGISITIPPLAARRPEIAPLAVLFLERACAKLGRRSLAIAPPALECLERYAWPGNIRELRHVMERAAALCTGGAVDVDHLPLECTVPLVSATPDGAPSESESPPRSTRMRDEVKHATRSLERDRIVNALERCAGNQSAAARVLGISRRTLVARLVEYRIPRPIKGKEC